MSESFLPLGGGGVDNKEQSTESNPCYSTGSPGTVGVAAGTTSVQKMAIFRSGSNTARAEAYDVAWSAITMYIPYSGKNLVLFLEPNKPFEIEDGVCSCKFELKVGIYNGSEVWLIEYTATNHTTAPKNIYNYYTVQLSKILKK